MLAAPAEVQRNQPGAAPVSGLEPRGPVSGLSEGVLVATTLMLLVWCYSLLMRGCV